VLWPIQLIPFPPNPAPIKPILMIVLILIAR
jgi:hypothetical protein